MLKSAVKKKCRHLSTYRWFADNQKLKPERSFEKWIQLFSTIVFNRGSWSIFGGVANRYFMYTAVLHFLYSSFRCGSLGYRGLLWWVAVQKKVENNGLAELPSKVLRQTHSSRPVHCELNQFTTHM